MKSRVLLSSLSPGDRFACPETDQSGRLVKANECRAVVRLDRPEREVEFEDSTGVVKSFKVKAGGITSWTPSVMVVPLDEDEPVPPADFSWMMKPNYRCKPGWTDESIAAEMAEPKPVKVERAVEPTPASVQPTRASAAPKKIHVEPDWTGFPPAPKKPAPPKTIANPQPPTGTMSILDAAAEILKREGKPMHVNDLVPKMAAAGLWTSSGKTPWKTLWVALSSNVTKADARFVKAGPSIFGLK